MTAPRPSPPHWWHHALLPLAYCMAKSYGPLLTLGRVLRAVVAHRRLRMALRAAQMLAFPLVLALGTYGFSQVQGVLGFWDALYRSVQMFGLNFELPEGVTAIPLALHFARFGAAVVSVGTVLLLVLSKMGSDLRIRLQALVMGHDRVVLLGFGQVNRALARVLIEQGHPVTVATGDINASHRDMSARMGCALHVGDLFEVDTLKRLALTRCTKVIVACGNDEVNVEIANAASGLIQSKDAPSLLRLAARNLRDRANPWAEREDGAPIVHVHISDVTMLMDLEDANDVAYAGIARMNGFSVKVDMARDLINRARLPLRAREMGQDQVHLVIVGFGDLGHAVLNETLTTAYSRWIKKPVRITILDRDAEALCKKFKAIRGALFDQQIRECVEIDFQQVEVDDISFEDTPSEPNFPREGVTAWVFSCGDDTTNLKAGVRLEMAMLRGRWPFAPIFVKLWSANIATDKSPARNPLLITQIFGNITDTARHNEVVNPAYERLAMALHLEYQALNDKNFADSWDEDRRKHVADGFRGAWNNLPANIKESNRKLGRSIRSRLMDEGLQWRGMTKSGLPSFTDKQRTAIREGLLEFEKWAREVDPFDESIVKHLSEICDTEHNRWMVNYALGGWRRSQSGKTIKPDRLHANLLPFLDIKKADLLYDLLPDFLIANSADSTQSQLKIFDKDRPAFNRQIAVTYLSAFGGWQRPGNFFCATEIVLHISGAVLGKKHLNALERTHGDQALSDLLAWSKNKFASRIHIKGDRWSLDQLSGVKHDLLTLEIGRFVANLKTALANDITVDVTYHDPSTGDQKTLADIPKLADYLDQLSSSSKSNEETNDKRLYIFAEKLKSEAPLRIAVTGHRWNRMDVPAGTVARLGLRAAFSTIRTSTGCVTLTTGMAEGADLIAVDEMPANWRLDPVLATTESEWRIRLQREIGNILGSNANDRKRALEYDIAVFNKVRLPAYVRHNALGQAVDYAEVGRKILDGADLLIAIWDGEKGQKGGTAEVVAEARQNGIPVWHIAVSTQ